jgi:hypothetical protein
MAQADVTTWQMKTIEIEILELDRDVGSLDECYHVAACVCLQAQ